MEQIIYIKMDLVLNNLQRLIYHKTQQTKPSLLLSLLGPILPGVVARGRILSMDQIELNNVLMLNWIVGIRTVFDI